MSDNSEPLPTIDLSEFERADMRVGRITRAEAFPEARRPAYRLWIDFGPLGVKQSSAQITVNYDVGELVGRQVIAVVNFSPRQIANFMSEVLVLGVPASDGEVVLLSPDIEVPKGGRVF